MKLIKFVYIVCLIIWIIVPTSVMVIGTLLLSNFLVYLGVIMYSLGFIFVPWLINDWFDFAKTKKETEK